MREIPKKNYLFVLIMAVVVVIITFVLMNLYNANKKEVYSSYVKEIVHEIMLDDLDNYLQEHPDAILYINTNDEANKKLEKEIKNLIARHNIQQYFVYIENNKDITKKYKLKDNNPVFIAYKDGKVLETFSQDKYTIKEIESFLVRNGVIEND